MKLKEVLYGLGLRPRNAEYGYEIRTFQLPTDGEVQLAVWQHPSVTNRRPRLTQRMVDALRAFLQPGDAAVDVGAQYGDSPLPIALAVGPAGKVFALEPNRYAFKVLEVNARLNPAKANIVPLMFAAMPEDGEYEFHYQDAGFANGGLIAGVSPWRHGSFFKQKVQGRNLLAYLRAEHAADLPRVRFVKIDTEGDDHAVARSIRDLLVANRPYIKTELYTHRTAEERAAYYRWLRELGYRLYRTNEVSGALGEEEYAAEPLAETDLMRWKHLDMFAVPDERA